MLKGATMTITLELTPEAEAKLTSKAKARGLSLDAFLQFIITTQAAAMDPANGVQPLSSEGGDTDRRIDEIFDTVPIPPGVGNGVMTRETWYK